MSSRTYIAEAALCFLLLVLPGCPLDSQSTPPIPLTTPYQAVLLDNGQFFFGKLDQSLPGYLLLTDVYYITSVRDPNTKEVKSILLKRGKEWHSPDRMYLTRRHVVAIEPVATNSKIADLIQKEKSGTKP
ncbi:MAG: hypothetical protein ACYCYP_03385 [Leptospirales bacterium]